MKVKTFTALSEKGLDKKINAFLEDNPQVQIIDIKFSYGSGSLGVLIIYQY